MARSHSLRLLLAAEIPRDADAEHIELLLTAITARIDVLKPGSADHVAAHARIDELLRRRDAALTD